MRILLGLDSWYPSIDGVVGTVENYHKNLASGNDCEIVVPKFGKNISSEHSDGVYYTKSVKILGLDNYVCPTPKFDAQLAKKVKNGGYDVLHAHSPFMVGEFFVKAGKKYKIPTVYTFHTKFKDEFLAVTKSKLLTAYLMHRIVRTISKFDSVIAVSGGAAETLKEYGYKGEIKVIRNGTDMQLPCAETEREYIDLVDEKFGLKGEENVFLYVGRVVAVKNIPFTLNVLKILKEKGLNFKFLIVGDGAERKHTENLVFKMGLSSNVIFTGAITDKALLQAIYVRADIYLLPSKFDNASLTIIEAASGALPSIVPKGSSISEVIKDGENGFTLDEDTEIWAEKIEELISDKQRLKNVGENARRDIYRSWADVTKELTAYYGEVIDEYKKGVNK